MRLREFSRRRFLGHAGAAAGASLVMPKAFPQEPAAVAPATGSPVLHHPAYELDDGKTADPAEWAAVGPGLHVSFASKDACYFRHAVPGIAPAREHLETAWRGERVNILALAWASENVGQVRLVAGAIEKRQRRADLAGEPPGPLRPVCRLRPRVRVARHRMRRIDRVADLASPRSSRSVAENGPGGADDAAIVDIDRRAAGCRTRRVFRRAEGRVPGREQHLLAAEAGSPRCGPAGFLPSGGSGWISGKTPGL